MSFSSRESFFIAASRLIASLFVAHSSRESSVTGLRPRVYFTPRPALCAASRFYMSLVQPV